MLKLETGQHQNLFMAFLNFVDVGIKDMGTNWHQFPLFNLHLGYQIQSLSRPQNDQKQTLEDLFYYNMYAINSPVLIGSVPRSCASAGYQRFCSDFNRMKSALSAHGHCWKHMS